MAAVILAFHRNILYSKRSLPYPKSYHHGFGGQAPFIIFLSFNFLQDSILILILR